MNDMKEPVLIVTFAVVVMVFMGGIGYLATSQRSKNELVCREQMLQANRSTDDILKVCLGK
jgi:hypothetical protein